MGIQFTEQFISNITGAFGEAGKIWLKDLDNTLDLACEKWALRLEPPYQPMTYNYVAPAISGNGDPVVLKAGVPHREFTNEINALKHFDGLGMVNLLKSNSESGLMLLEKIEPGDFVLNQNSDDKATSIYVDILMKLKRAESDSYKFPDITDWHKAFIRHRAKFNGGTGSFPEKYLSNAESLFKELLNAESEKYILHGDLHHWNIISGTRESWLGIDPKGIVGPPEYECGAWLRNPYSTILDEPNLSNFIDRRISTISESLGYDSAVILGWAYYQVVLSALWSYEENLGDWYTGLELADRFLDKI